MRLFMSDRDIELYVADIVDSCNAIESFIDGMDFDAFCEDRKTYSATIREFTVIGEAIGKIIDVLEAKYPEYPWRALKDFRNFIVHEYFGVNPKIIYDAATLELAELKSNITLLHCD